MRVESTKAIAIKCSFCSLVYYPVANGHIKRKSKKGKHRLTIGFDKSPNTVHKS